MPIFTDQTPPVVGTAPDVFNPVVLDTSTHYLSKNNPLPVTGFIDGSPWTVIYFNKYIGRDDVLSQTLDTNNPTIIQYLKIFNFELRVTSALASVHDDVTGTDTLTGEANVYPVITPILGDVFIGLIEPNVYGVFQITLSSRKGIYGKSAWGITYSLISYLTPDYQAILNNYVIKEEVIFYKHLLGTQEGPLVTKSLNSQLIDKQTKYNEVLTNYYNTFYNLDLDSLVYDTVSYYTVYDPHLLRFFNRYISLTPGLKKPIEFDSRNAFSTKKYNTVFDAIIHQNRFLLANAVKKMDIVSVANFQSLYIRYLLDTSNLNYIVLPFYTTERDISTILTLTDTPYIFSYDFYNNTIANIPTADLFESLTLSVMKNETILFKDVLTAIDNALLETLDKQYYKIPLLLLYLQLSQ